VKRKISMSVFAAAALGGLLLAFSGSGAPDMSPSRAWSIFATKAQNAGIHVVQDLEADQPVDPSIDDGDTFSYFARPSFQIGLRGQPYATQVMEGHLWTGAAEWMPFIGQKPEPVSERIWTLRKG